MACKVATAALQVLVDEDLAANAMRLGEKLRTALRSIQSPAVELVRGRGLLNAVVIKVCKTGVKLETVTSPTLSRSP